jgi:putative Mn2+ efflux pump MntP
MAALKPQTALGGFALITLLLAGAAVGRVMGVSFGEALYLTGLLLVILGWLGNRVMMRHSATSSEDREA